MPRFKNVDWDLSATPSGGIKTWDAVHIAVLMDIRDELQALNRVMQCPNVQRGFRAMERMDRRLAKDIKLRG
jgi:hypothetical protein